MHLEALAGGGAEIPLAHVGGEVVEEAEEVGREFSGGLFEAEHELVILGFSFFLAVGLHVGSVVFEDLHGVFCDADFFGICEGLIVFVVVCVCVCVCVVWVNIIDW